MDVLNQPRALRILLVEDHADTAEVFARGIKSKGHDVQVAADYSTALRLGQNCDFDLLMCDIALPDGNGSDLLPTLRSICGNPALRGIILSAKGMAADLQQARAAGYEAHLIKPVTFEEIFAAIDQRLPAQG